MLSNSSGSPNAECVVGETVVLDECAGRGERPRPRPTDGASGQSGVKIGCGTAHKDSDEAMKQGPRAGRGRGLRHPHCRLGVAGVEVNRSDSEGEGEGRERVTAE